MYDTAERIRRVELLAVELERKRQARWLGGLSTLSLLLSLSLVASLRSMSGGARGNTQGTYGAMLLFEDAGGYVLVGVITFALAVVITVLCIRHRENMKKTTHKQ